MLHYMNNDNEQSHELQKHRHGPLKAVAVSEEVTEEVTCIVMSA